MCALRPCRRLWYYCKAAKMPTNYIVEVRARRVPRVAMSGLGCCYELPQRRPAPASDVTLVLCDWLLAAQYSRSSRASCKKCKAKIQKGVVRTAGGMLRPLCLVRLPSSAHCCSTRYELVCSPSTRIGE